MSLKSYEKYKVRENIYERHMSGDSSRCHTRRWIDGTGDSLIYAAVFTEMGLAHEKHFYFHHPCKFFRERRHKKEMLKALSWAFDYFN